MMDMGRINLVYIFLSLIRVSWTVSSSSTSTTSTSTEAKSTTIPSPTTGVPSSSSTSFPPSVVTTNEPTMDSSPSSTSSTPFQPSLVTTNEPTIGSSPTASSSTPFSPSAVTSTVSTTGSSPSSSTTASTTFVTSSPLPDCGQPPNVENSEVMYTGTTVGSIAIFYCLPGYNITGPDYIECLRNGSWGQPLTECLPRDCGQLAHFANADVTYYPRGTSSFGTIAVLQCQSGYILLNLNYIPSNTSIFRCSVAGIWTGDFSVVCMAAECGNLAPLANGVLTPYSKTPGSVVTYTCNAGYKLLGFQSRICLDSGQWSGRPPTCTQTQTVSVPPCPLEEDSRRVKWNETLAGITVSIPCSSLSQNVSGEVTRKCTENGRWLLPHYNCVRKEIESIKNVVNAIKDDPTENTVEDVLDQLSTLTTQSTDEATYSGDIQTISSTLEAIADINYENISLTERQSQAFIETTSNLLDPSNAESWQSIDQELTTDETVSGASKILNSVSTYTEAISSQLDNSTTNRSISVSNILVQVRRLNNSGTVTFPDSDQHVFSSSLSLPKESLTGSSRYAAVIYRNLTGVMFPKGSFNRSNMEIGSSVMTVKLDQWDRVDNFTVRMTFRNFKQDNVLSTCSYRNESRNNWETDGCVQKSFNSTMTVCECDHLTNFAILMSPWTEDNVDTTAIRIISIVGCSVSVLGLLITIATHINYWRYVKCDRVKILMNLCLALLISYALFLGGVDRTENKDVCTAMAVLLQYIYLVVFFLMLAEGVEISVIVLYVFTTKSRLKWILPCAWLTPALIVGISLGATQSEGYGNEQFCWLSVDNGLIWAFVAPALLIILVNFVLIVLVMRAMFRTKTMMQKSNKERTIAGVRCLCVLLPLVGCTWVIGIFYVNESMAWIQYVFAVCNSLQGLAIFIFHCALNSQLRQAYNRKKKLPDSTSYTKTKSSSNPLIISKSKSSLVTSDNDYNSNSSGTEYAFSTHL